MSCQKRKHNNFTLRKSEKAFHPQNNKGLQLPEPSPCLFERLRIWHPKKDDYQDCTLIIIILGCQLAKYPTAEIQPRIFRPTVQWEMAKSLIARKDRGTARAEVI
jgi:hypothetical protein